MVDEDDRQKASVREALKQKKKKMKAKDLTRAISKQTDFADGVSQCTVARSLAKPKGVVRSASIQNNQSTKVSGGAASESNNLSDDGTANGLKRSNRSNNDVSRTSNLNKEAALQNDIMELISEEELSVCRSEGSPPRKAKKGKVSSGEDQHEGINRRKKDGGTSVGKRATGVASAKGLKIRPERVKRLSDF